jgi:hypothetical protein
MEDPRVKTLIVGVVLALSLSTAFAAPITFTLYTDYNTWNNALPTPPFDHDAFGPGQIIGDLALSTTTGSFGAPRGVFPAGTNVWIDRVTEGGGEVTTFFDGDGDQALGFIAFGGFWDMSPGGYGQGLTLTITKGFQSSHVMDICGDPTTLCPGGPGQSVYVADGTFFGIILDPGEKFDAMSISADHQPGSAETFDLSGFAMVHAIPEPATMLLLGAGLVGVGLWRKARG